MRCCCGRVRVMTIKNYWIQIKEVRMHNTEWVPSLSRTAYYRPTVGKQCEHKDTWTGEDDMLLNIREWFKCLSVQLLRSYKFICMVLKFANISFLWMVEKFKISFCAILSFMQIDLHCFKICIHIISLKTFEPFLFSKDKMGVPIHVISYNWLLNYTSAF